MKLIQHLRAYAVPVLCLIILAALYVGFTLWLRHEVRIQTPTSTFPVMGSDSAEYAELSDQILLHHRFVIPEYNQIETFRTPGYPFFLAIGKTLTGSYLGAVLLQILLTLLGIALLISIGKKGRLPYIVTWAAVVFFALDPLLIYSNSLVMSDALYVFFIILATYLAVRTEGIDQFNALSVGSILGIAALIRPIGIFLPLPFLIFLWMKHRRISIKKCAFICSFMLLGWGIFTVPWMMRNKLETGVFTLSSIPRYNLINFNIPQYLSWKNHVPVKLASNQIQMELGHPSDAYLRSMEAQPALQRIIQKYVVKNFVSYAFFHVTHSAVFLVSALKSVAIDLRTDGILSFRSADLFQNHASSAIGGVLNEARRDPLFFLDRLWWMLIIILAIPTIRLVLRDPVIALFWLLSLYSIFLAGPVGEPRYRLPAEPFLLFLGFLTAYQFAFYLLFRFKVKVADDKRGDKVEGIHP